MRGKIRRLFYSTQRKIIFFITLLLALLFSVTFSVINRVIMVDRYESLSEQYSYLNDRVLTAFENIRNELDDLSGEFILNEYVQKSLTRQTMTAADIEMMKNGLSLYTKNYLDYYLVIDNKGNMYSRRHVSLNLETILNSDVVKSLGDEYSQTRILWAKDEIFGTNEMSFFTVRYIRSLNYNHEPGILIMKLNDNLLKEVQESIVDERLFYLILDSQQQICFGQFPNGKNWDPEDEELMRILQEEKENHEQKSHNYDLDAGIVDRRYDENTQFTIITYAPPEVTNAVMEQIQQMLLPIFLLSYIIAVFATVFFSRKLGAPIRYLSDTMTNFDASNIEERIVLHTNTELDQIGQAYNAMLVRIKNLMEDVKETERKLRQSELDSLMYQIRPHFLYNTLDTIYMLARIQKEETIMHMIQSLSRFLRINLSNGNEKIEAAKELEHVSSYLDIQKVRNADLFTYRIEMDEAARSQPVMKMILQPVAENCIKYGFRNMDEGGIITIRTRCEESFLVFEIENNGDPIEEEALLQLNRLECISIEEIDRVLQKKQGGYGIRNVVKRLRMRYGDALRFYYEALTDGTKCTIKIPLEDENPAEQTEENEHEA